MSRNETTEKLRSINDDIASGRLKAALEQMLALSEQKMLWEIGTDIKTISANYGYMMSYFVDGIVDPDLDNVFGRMQLAAWALFDRLRRAIDIPGHSSLYFGTLRLRQMHGEKLETLLAKYFDAIAADADIVSTLAGAATDTAYRGQRPKEDALKAVFEYIWTQHPLSCEDISRLADGIETVAALSDNDRDVSAYSSAVIAALMLGDLQYADTNRQVGLCRLYTTYAESRPEIALKALCALATMLFRHRRRPVARPVADILASMAENATWPRDIKTVFIELVRTRNTENVDHTMRSEIIPGVNKMRDSIMSHIKERDLPTEINSIEDFESLETNPEWEGMLEQSGIADGLRRLGEMQQDGADIFMSTFAHLKNFAFFNDVANWFAPYNPEHSQVVEAVGPLDQLARIVDKLPFLCDSDKYSMALSVDMVPQAQRDFIMGQLTHNAEHFAEQSGLDESNMTNRDISATRTARAFLQNFYRFVKLFRRKGEFADPYRDGLNLLTVPALAPYIQDTELVTLVGEYYFKYGYWDDALTAFRHIEDCGVPDAALYQKTGYCHEQLGDYAAALSAYEHAELLDGNNLWLLRRLAYTNRRLERHGRALEYYKRLSDAAPEDFPATLSLAYAYMRLKRWAKALNQLRKAEFIAPDDTRLWRPLAWTLFASGDYEASRKYWQKVLSDSPKADDHFNIGHLDAATGHIRDAIGHYRLSQPDGDAESLVRHIEADSEILRNAGISPVELILIKEAIRDSPGS